MASRVGFGLGSRRMSAPARRECPVALATSRARRECLAATVRWQGGSRSGKMIAAMR